MMRNGNLYLRTVLMGLCGLMGVGLMETALGNNLGNYGQVFPVIEEDIRTVILKRLHHMESTGELARRQREIDTRVANHVVRPSPLSLVITNKPEVFHVDPTVTLSQDIWTPDGALVAKAGTRINPFERVHFSKTLFFFNGDDAQQVAWAKSHYKDYEQVKFILTGGDIRDAAAVFGRIYFDMGGVLTTQLQIRHVPSVVNQDGLLWTVTEIGMDHHA